MLNKENISYNVLTTKEKLRQYLNFKRVSKRQFCQKANLSDGFLKGNGAIGTDKLAIIRKIAPDLNMNWLLFDEGEMILADQENGAKDFNIDNKEAANYDVIRKFLGYDFMDLKDQLDRIEALNSDSDQLEVMNKLMIENFKVLNNNLEENMSELRSNLIDLAMLQKITKEIENKKD